MKFAFRLTDTRTKRLRFNIVIHESDDFAVIFAECTKWIVTFARCIYHETCMWNIFVALSICKLIQACRKRTEDRVKETDLTHVANNNVNYGNYVEIRGKIEWGKMRAHSLKHNFCRMCIDSWSLIGLHTTRILCSRRYYPCLTADAEVFIALVNYFVVIS